MKIYRVEHADNGVGPYNSKYAPEGMAHEHSADRAGHPSPVVDGIVEFYSDIRPEYLCGLTERAAIFAWFDGWLRTLHERGFVLATYEVPAEHVLTGRSEQVLFDRHEAALVATEALA